MNMGVKLLNPDYRDMVECLLREGVDFMLVGGYAVALHGWPRTTFDIDFWIMDNPENAKAVMRAIKAFGARSSGRPKDVADAVTLEKLREKKKNG